MEHEGRRRSSGAEVEIGGNDFQGAYLSRYLLHGSNLESERKIQFRPDNVFSIYSHPSIDLDPAFNVHAKVT